MTSSLLIARRIARREERDCNGASLFSDEDHSLPPSGTRDLALQVLPASCRRWPLPSRGRVQGSPRQRRIRPPRKAAQTSGGLPFVATSCVRTARLVSAAQFRQLGDGCLLIINPGGCHERGPLSTQ